MMSKLSFHLLHVLLALWLPWTISIIAAQSASPKLMWCASPLTPAVLESPIDKWVDVPDTSVTVELQNEAVVMMSYDVSVSHVTDIKSEGVQVAELSELSFRVAVDGTPYRQSATTVDDREPLIVVASGFLVLEIPQGHHSVKLQWRKRGTRVLKWAVTSDILDGFAGGRSLTVSAQHRFIWYKQPTTTVSLLSVNKWEAVSGMSVNFRLSEPATIRFFYQLPVRPELVQYSRDTAAYDEIETSLEINGLRYRETGSYGIVEGSRKSTVLLQGSIIMDLLPGEYSAVLYWKALLGSSRPWYSSPNALDGFAMGRILAAVGEWSMDSMSVYNLQQFKPTSVGKWSDVGDSVLQFTLPKATQVSLSYNLPLSQSDNPQFSSWTEDSWDRIQTRVNSWNNDPKIFAPTVVLGEEDTTVEIDGISISDTDSEMALDYEVTVTISVRNGVLSLDPTPGITFASGNGDRNQYLLFSGALSSVNAYLARVWYRSYLNWYGDDELRIKVVDQGVTGFTAASTDETSIVIHIASVNDPPQLTVPSTQFLLEDQQISIFGVRVHDVDPGFDHSNSTFEMQLFVLSGVVSLGSTSGVAFIEGDGKGDQLFCFRGDLRTINSALFEIKYRPDKDFNSKQHVERLGIRVRDYNYLDGTVTDAFKSILIEVQSSNDPTLVVPLELSTITLRGYAVELVGETTGNEVVYAQLLSMTAVGEIQLSTPSSALPAGVTKLPVGDEPSNLIKLSGHVSGVSDILQSITFMRAPSFYGDGLMKNSGVDLCAFGKRMSSARYLSSSSVSCKTPKVEKGTTDVDLRLTSNGQDFSQPLLFSYRDPPEINSIDPSYGSSSGGDVIAVAGANFFPDTQANCVFDGDIVTAASFKSSSSMLCLSPAVPIPTEPMTVSIAVILDAMSYRSPKNFSIYEPNFTIVSFHKWCYKYRCPSNVFELLRCTLSRP
ncbi:uncharacterized protein PITG_05441 [Phytophthora infestans T30-4]|uniref:IPT/TIG domain-containing protein n=1 Tax=Phytophthora infestans (strain T30-4) TaxID=403677 RepID=D0N2T8_PHYIT|nr:uncharacterized protein PITG_05441 [Phytophthora infestans T30-4]EEY69230.1 conserved hypothetical protein [Phytophthora infestans T30-4]|eukprot:XP_002999084.1 conserved hypothetical protein [Phytophthora infestans T30-4]